VLVAPALAVVAVRLAPERAALAVPLAPERADLAVLVAALPAALPVARVPPLRAARAVFAAPALAVLRVLDAPDFAWVVVRLAAFPALVPVALAPLRAALALVALDAEEADLVVRFDRELLEEEDFGAGMPAFSLSGRWRESIRNRPWSACFRRTEDVGARFARVSWRP
jgi:hypothetical protein